MYIIYTISVLTLGASFWRTSFFPKKKNIFELHPTCPFLEFRIQPSTLGGEFSPPDYTHPWQLGPTCVVRLCKRAKACFQRPQPSKDAMALLKLTESWIFHDKISENCHGFQHVRSVSCDIAYVCIYNYTLHICIIYVHCIWGMVNIYCKGGMLWVN